MRTQKSIQSMDIIKIVTFCIILIILSIGLVGIIPLLIVLISTYLMRERKDVEPIVKAGNYIKKYFKLLGSGIVILVIINYIGDEPKDWVTPILIFFIGASATILITKFFMDGFTNLYLIPIIENKEYIFNKEVSFWKNTSIAKLTNGLRSDKNKAEEILKWNELLKKEIITQEYFDAKKTELLGV